MDALKAVFNQTGRLASLVSQFYQSYHRICTFYCLFEDRQLPPRVMKMERDFQLLIEAAYADVGALELEKLLNHIAQLEKSAEKCHLIALNLQKIFGI